MLLLDTLSRILHVSTAIVLVGGSVFTLFVLLPSVKMLTESAHRDFATAVTGRWKRFIYGGIALFLITGFYNYYRAMPSHRGDSLYHALLGTKMLLALVVFFLASALVGRSAKLEGFRKNKSRWLKAVVIIAAIIVCISGYLKVRGNPSMRSIEVVEVAG